MSESETDRAPPEGAQALEQPPPASAGARLTAERRNQGLSLGDIARQLKLSVRQVEALERDDYASFAGQVFVRGFVRNYAKLLNLDPGELVAAASPPPAAVNAVAAVVEEQRHPAANPERHRRILTGTAIAALLVAAIVLLASKVGGDRRADVPSNDAPALQTPGGVGPIAQSEPPLSTPTTARPSTEGSVAQQKPASVAANDAPAQSDAQPPAGAQPAATPSSPPPGTIEPANKPQILVSGSGPAQVRMVFEGESWVQVKDASGATIFSRLSLPGTERLIKGNPPLSLVVGNANSVKLMYHEKAVDLQPHTRVDVARITLE